MSTVVIGGTGFIGHRLIPILEKQGEPIVCMDINPGAGSFGEHVKVVRGDVTQFDEVMAVVAEAKPDRLINLSYYIGSDLPPRVATKLNVRASAASSTRCTPARWPSAASRRISASARRPKPT